MGQSVTVVHPDFGGVKVDDFHPSAPTADSNAAALVLEDIGKTELEGYDRGWRVKYTQYRRVLIRNKNGFDVAKVSISFNPYFNDTGKLAALWAVTNNLENGKVVQTKVESPDMFLDQKSNGNKKETFTFPNVKPGSIIEYTYSLYSGNIYTLFPWDFQGKYPCLRSEYSVTMPELFNYAISKQGPFTFNRRVDSVKSNILVGNTWVRTKMFTFNWAMKDVPSYDDEPYVTTMDNYVSGVRFQLSEVSNLSTRRRTAVLKNWETLDKELYKNSAFGGVMTTSSHWERRELRAIVSDSASDLEKARSIFAFVRDHFVTLGRVFIADGDLSLKDIYKARMGSVAEINLMLTALLREVGLAADAVILSTRDNGVLNPYYPMVDNFNYVIARVRIDGRDYLLDATEPRMGFGKLPLECYNGYARIIGKTGGSNSTTGGSLNLTADSVLESRFTSVMLTDNDAGDSVIGQCTAVEGYYGSMLIRETVAKDGEGSYFDDIRKDCPFEVKLTDKKIDALKDYDKPVTVHYTLNLATPGTDHFYLNPMLGNAMRKNPFASAERQYPIAMPYTRNELYVMHMDIPKGLELEELPKPVKVVLNENDGSYEYALQVDGQSIQLRSKLVLKRADFRPEEYQSLRDFFAMVVKKQSEVIVFRRKK